MGYGWSESSYSFGCKPSLVLLPHLHRIRYHQGYILEQVKCILDCFFRQFGLQTAHKLTLLLHNTQGVQRRRTYLCSYVFYSILSLYRLRSILPSYKTTLRNLTPKLRVLSLGFCALLFISSCTVEHKHEEEHEDFNVKEFTFHHLLDSYDFELYEDSEQKLFLTLPRILWHNGLHAYANTEAAIHAGWHLENAGGHSDPDDAAIENHNEDHLATPTLNPEALHGALLAPGVPLEKIYSIDSRYAASTSAVERAELAATKAEILSNYRPMDFSITKNVVVMLLAAFVLILLMLAVAKKAKSRAGKSPKGIQSFFEPVIVFIRDEIAAENIPDGKHRKYLPFLLTLFFFILILNLLGLVPFSANVSGNISFTLALSLCTLIVVNFSGSKSYWSHIFWPPVPLPVKVIMIPLEILSIFSKPFALTIRLFANISGGHIVMLSLVSLVFIFGKGGEAAGTGFTVGILTSLFSTAIGLLEVFVALLQAYVFTLLTAIFIGQAVATDDH